MAEKLKTFKIFNGIDNAFITISLSSKELLYDTFAKKILVIKGMNVSLSHCLSIKYKNRKQQPIYLLDQTSFSSFIDSGIQNVEVKILPDDYLSEVFKQDCRKRKFKLLSQLNTAIRNEQKERISQQINQQRTLKSLIQSQVNTHLKPLQCLGNASVNFSQLTQKVSSYDNSLKNINDSIALSMKINQSEIISKSRLVKEDNLYNHRMPCDNCRKNMMGMRHLCSFCEYNLCQKCKIENQHGHCHKYFIEIPNSEEYTKENNRNENESINLHNEPPSLMSPLQTVENEPIDDISLGYFLFINSSEDVTNYSFFVGYKSTYQGIKLVLNIPIPIPGVTVKCLKLSDEKIFKLQFKCETLESGEYLVEGSFTNDGKNIDKPFKIVVYIK